MAARSDASDPRVEAHGGASRRANAVATTPVTMRALSGPVAPFADDRTGLNVYRSATGEG
jgi:hypothetical protein